MVICTCVCFEWGNPNENHDEQSADEPDGANEQFSDKWISLLYFSPVFVSLSNIMKTELPLFHG